MLLILLIWSVNKANSSDTPDIFKFLVQPKSQSTNDGSSVAFTCRATNGQSLPVNYSWFRSSRVRIPPDENNRLQYIDNEITLNVSRTDTNLLFQCCAESEGQKIYSDVAKVTITYFEFTGSPVSRYIVVEETEAAVATSCSCLDQTYAVTSNQAFEIVWYKGEDNVADLKLRDSRSWMSPVETEVMITVEGSDDLISLVKIKRYDLVFYNLRMSDSATYFCKAVQGDKKILLATCTLQVRQEFSNLKYFITDPVVGYLANTVSPKGKLNNEVLAGGNVTLLCGGVGFCAEHARLSYTWFYEGEIVNKNKQYNVTDPGRGKYQCAVRCGVDLVTGKGNILLPIRDGSSPVVEFVQSPPAYKGYILGKTLGDIDIPCTISDTSQFRKTYYMNGQELQVPIKVEAARNMRSGVVQCSFIDMLTSTLWVQRATQLSIIGKPVVETILPLDLLVGRGTLHVYEEQSVSFQFRVASPGSVKVLLYYNGEENAVCEQGVRENEYSNEKCSVEDGLYTVTIEGFTKQNAGTYELEGTTEYYLEAAGGLKYTPGSYTAKASVLLVLVDECKAEFSVVPEMKVYMFGAQVKLSCSAEGYPVPSVVFYKDGIALGLWESSCQRGSGSLRCDLALSQYSESGVYSCMVYNEIRRRRYHCNTTSYNIAFVGKPTINSVTLRETKEYTEGVCTAEGSPVPATLYWLAGNSDRFRIKSATFAVNEYRIVGTLNITTGSDITYQCCIEDENNFSLCKPLLPQVVPYEEGVQKTNFWKNEEKLVIGLLIGFALLIIIGIVVAVICFKRRRRQRKAYKQIEKNTENGNHEYATTETTKQAKRGAVPAPAEHKETAGSYAEVEFTPDVKSSKKARSKKAEAEPTRYNAEPTSYAAVRVRPVSNPRYATSA